MTSPLKQNKSDDSTGETENKKGLSVVTGEEPSHEASRDHVISNSGVHSKFGINRDEDEPWRKEQASDFLYDRKGPWPQPSPEHPMGQAPAVIHVPRSENTEFFKKIGLRYLWQAAVYTPLAFVKGLIKPGVEPVSDKEFISIVSETIIAKLIKDTFDKKDLEIFSPYMKEGENYCIVDMEAVKGIETFPGQYASASRTLLLNKGNYNYELIAISVYASREVFTPADGDAWKLAKYYALQGAALVTTLLEHPLVHFPYDAINAITKTAVPKEHILFRLLYPHTFLTLALENAVLEGKNSIISDRTWLPYTLYPGPGPQLKELLVKGYMGIRGNSSYPPYSYPKGPRKPLSTYDEYLTGYFHVIYNFVDEILKELDRDDYYVKMWARYCSHQINGFPDENEITKDDNLVRAVAVYIWTVSVNHSVDHYNYGTLNLRQVPMRLRQPPPHKKTKLWNLRKVNNWVDYGKYYMANLMFYKSLTVAPMMECKYNFRGKEQKILKNFRKQLVRLDEQFTRENKNYMPLSKIGVSIQF